MNPNEYIRVDKLESLIEEDPRTIAYRMLKNICQFQATQTETYLEKIFKYVVMYIKQGVDPCNNKIKINELKKECLLRVLCIIWKEVKLNDSLLQNIEPIMEKFVICELTNKNNHFLRYRACQFFARYGFIDFQNKKNVKNAVTGIYKCIQDSELAVKVQAAIALNQMVEQEEAIQILKPGLNQILSNYLKIMSQTDNNEVVESLQEFVLTFGDDITTYAADLVKHLSHAFFKYTNYNQQTGSCALHTTVDTDKEGWKAPF